MQLLYSPEAWISLATLTVLEIVLGIDNIIFISILTSKLPEHQQTESRQIGLSLAMITRILLLLSLSWMMSLNFPLINIGPWLKIQNTTLLQKLAFSGRDIILLVGGLFLIYKSTSEIHEKLETENHSIAENARPSFWKIIVQIILIDIVFSFDSVITAIGMAQHIEVMIVAVILAVATMMYATKGISNFVNKHPTIKMLALAFLLLIGVSLVAEGFKQHIPKGYLYFAMAFSMLVEMLNLRNRKTIKMRIK